MAKINLKALASQSFNKSTIYVAIVEAIVNAINAIEDKGNLNNGGKIQVKFLRNNQQSLSLGGTNEVIPNIIGIEISDNGIGFNDINKESFSTVYSDYKQSRGGLGFGRISYLKFFDNISFLSRYEENGEIKERSWNFTPLNEFEGITERSTSGATGTILKLGQIKQKYINTIDKNFEVVVRRICEKLLGYFAFNAELPEIIFQDSLDSNDDVTLQDFLSETEKIIKFVDCEQLEIENECFLLSIIKVYNTQLGNSINICAHNREIIEYPMGDIEKLLQEGFIDDEQRRYSVVAYISGNYLDNNVNNERNGFNLPLNSSEQLLYPEFNITIEDLLETIGNKLRNYLNNDYVSRQNIKQGIIDKYFEDNPMYIEYKDLINSMNWGISISPQDISLEISKSEIHKRETVYEKFEKIKNGTIIEETAINEILGDISDFNKIELAKYIINRKKILELLERKLEYINQDEEASSTSNYEKEKALHNIIFPMKSDSQSVEYFDHNLWLVDERLNFSEYISSDNSIEVDNPNGDRGDLICFQKNIVFREGDDSSNPIVVIEFKRPGRTNYNDSEDPILQVCNYVSKIRGGSMNNYKGRPITANDNTPAYGFIICDITEKIKYFAKNAQLSLTPDNLGYIGYHQGYNVYIEIISRTKLVKDANQRNRIFFKMLGIE